MTHLFISCPTHHAPEVEFAGSLLRLTHALRDVGIAQSIEMPAGDSLITRARNNAVARFLETECTHLLFIDSDQSFKPDDVMHLVACGRELVGALIPKKQIDWSNVRAAALRGEEDLEGCGVRYVVNPNPEQLVVQVQNGCVPVDAVGTGFLLVERSVIKRIIEANPDIAYMSDDVDGERFPRWAVFDCGIRDGRYLSEDYLFCLRARQLGIQPYINIGVRDIGHVGRHLFRGRIETAFQSTPPPVAA